MSVLLPQTWKQGAQKSTSRSISIELGEISLKNQNDSQAKINAGYNQTWHSEMQFGMCLLEKNW